MYSWKGCVPMAGTCTYGRNMYCVDARGVYRCVPMKGVKRVCIYGVPMEWMQGVCTYGRDVYLYVRGCTEGFISREGRVCIYERTDGMSTYGKKGLCMCTYIYCIGT